jgi:two-component system nitrogen regulation response regulator GlnG
VSSDRSEAWRDTDTRAGSTRSEAIAFSVPGLTILAHIEVDRVGERVALLDLVAGREERLSRLEPAFAQPGKPLRRPLADPHLSRRALVLQSEDGGGVRLSCRDSPMAVLADGEPVQGERVFSAPEVERGVVLLLARRVALLLHRFQPVSEALPGYGLIGESEALLELRRQIRQVAAMDVPVLLRGETGTGKELLAQAIHQASRRRDRPYLTVNMGAVPASLAAAELFGAARGAYTGADQKRRGFFSRADGGTLFLDEIGEVPPEVQPLLLRVLENGEIQPVGAEQTFRVDVRTISATDSDLEAAIAAGRLRAPLLHRLSGYEIRLPPLRERRDDIGRLFIHFLRKELEATGDAHRLLDPPAGGRPWLPASVVARLALFDWPGNVRQLRNAALALVVDNRLSPEVRLGPQIERLLPPEAGDTYPPPPKPTPPPALRRRSPQEIGDDELVAALRANRWEPVAAAQELGISRPALYLLIDACPRTRKAADLESDEIAAAFRRTGGRLAETAAQLEVSEEGLKRRMKKLGLRLSGGHVPEDR